MKLHLPAARLYVAESGGIRTEQSETGFMSTMRSLQNQFPHHHVDDFSTPDLTTFCLRQKLDGEKAAPNTIRTRRSHCRSFFGWATWKKLCSTNPALDLTWSVRPGRGTVRPKVWLDDEEVVDIYQTLSGDGLQDRRDRMLFLLFITTGLRLFEVAQVTWDMFDRDMTELVIKGKGDKIASLPLNKQARDELLEWRASAPADAVAVFPRFRWVASDSNLGGRILTAFWGKTMSSSGVSSVVERLSQRTGIRFRPHDLRRSFAGKLDREGMDVKRIQELLRHESSATTDNYLKQNPDRKKEAIKELNWKLS